MTARFGRIVLTALAIIVSTAFLSGTFIFRDTVERSFDALFAKSYEKVDVYVQSANSVETAFGFERRDGCRLESVAIVRPVAGVVDAQAFVQDDAVVIAKRRQADRAPEPVHLGRHDQHGRPVGVEGRSTVARRERPARSCSTRQTAHDGQLRRSATP